MRTYLRTHIPSWLDSLQPSESVVLGVAALLVGLTAGIGVWLFKQMIDWTHLVMFERLGTFLAGWGGWTIFLLPVVGGLVVGLILHNFVGEERHHGVAGIMEAEALYGGRLRYRRIPAKSVAAALAIGSGASVGPEDPSVQIGANLGSMFGQLSRLSDERVRALVAAGSAAGVSAAFNAPIAGVFFALEIVLGEISGSALGVVVLAAVISAAFTQAVAGAQPAFHVPAYELNSVWELLLYLGLGLLTGPISAYYIKLIYWSHDWFHHLTMARWLKPALAGTAVGLVGIFLPQIFGVGYETIEKILGGEELAIALLIALLFAKLILTSVSVGGGFPGGVFAPALFLGAVTGMAYGLIMSRFFPTLQIDAPAFAMVGMAAVLAGTVHAPLTAVLLLFEMTNDYRIILPLMFAVVVSMILSQRLQADSVYTLGLARKGIRIQHGRDVEVLQAITVGEVMNQEAHKVLHDSEPLSAAMDKLSLWRHHGLPVINEDQELIGILTIQDVEQNNRHPAPNEVGETQVGEVCTRELLVAHPEESLGAALRRMSVRDVGRLPVVDRDNPRRLLGVLRRTDVIRAYDTALTRRATLRHQAHQVRLGVYSGGVHIEEVTVEAGSVCEGCQIYETTWPHECVIASVRRGAQVIIPHGNTVLQTGDVLVVVADGESREVIQALCQAKEPVA